MRLVLIGQGAFCAWVLEALAGRGEELVAVCTVPDPGRGGPVVEASRKAGIPVFQPSSMRVPEVYEQFCSLKLDLGVMAFVTDIVPENILECPRLGTIEYHPSLLPRHRGASAINWAIIQGERRTGLTVFWVARGIDTGPILLQKEVEIGPDDTVGSLYFNKLFPLGVEAILEAVSLVKEDRAPRIPQDERLATYEPPCEEKHGLIDWHQPLERVYDLIRGTNPQPGATTTLRGKKLKLYDSERLPGVRGEPGEAVEVGEKGFAVACPGGAILVKRVQPEGAGKQLAPEFARQVALTAGERLG
jgi:methionyl-tRNA formyltransferase